MSDNQNEVRSINYELPKPIAMNCWKHHLGYVTHILNNQTNYSKNEAFIREIVQYIGESQFDYYIGSLDIFSVAGEIMSYLKSKNASSQIEYQKWLASEGVDYRCISLSDGSSWTLRLAPGNDRYVHIHPSRHSKRTVKVKSSSLKTVYAFLFYYGLSDAEVSIDKVNYVRNKFAKLPVFKSSSPLTAIYRILDLFKV